MSAFTVLLYDGLYTNHAVYKIATYEINIDRLKNSLVLSTIFSGFFSMSLDSQCGPSMRYEKYKMINICHIIYSNIRFI